MTDYTFREVDEVPRLVRRRPSHSKYSALIQETEMRLEQTRTKWLEIQREEPLTKHQARLLASALYAHFKLWHGGEGAIERRVRPNGGPDNFVIYIRRGKSYQK